jgi:hypothetical protein
MAVDRICGRPPVALVLLAYAATIPLSSDTLRLRIVGYLSERLDAEVHLSGLRMRLLPNLHLEGAGLTIRHRGRLDVPPLITVSSFQVDSGLLALYRKHVTRVSLNGLEILIPPNRQDDLGEQEDVEGPRTAGSRFVVDSLTSSNARLLIIPEEKTAPTRVWAIHELHMSSVGTDEAMSFEANLTNAVPPGTIETRGTFGPWNSEDPGGTPLHGAFSFDHADLGFFKGIGGILSARGGFSGTLQRLDVRGETDTPQFTVAISGQPVPLRTKYHAVVDATTGNTLLQDIDGSFLDTSLVATGAVVAQPGREGRTVRLEVTIDPGKLEDVLRLALNEPRPPMIGGLTLTTRFVLPPGEEDVVDRLELDGHFSLKAIRFTSPTVQNKIRELSNRSRGLPEAPPRSVSSNFDGRFKLGRGRLALPGITFRVPGATVALAGEYSLRRESLDFHGDLLMDAKLSETQKGIKRFLLKAIDPFFGRKGGGSAIPIRVSGTRRDPDFGLDRSRLFSLK